MRCTKGHGMSGPPLIHVGALTVRIAVNLMARLKRAAPHARAALLSPRGEN